MSTDASSAFGRKASHSSIPNSYRRQTVAQQHSVLEPAHDTLPQLSVYPLSTSVLSSSQTSLTSFQDNQQADSVPIVSSLGEPSIQKKRTSLQRTLADQMTPVRLAGHLSVLIVAALILILSQFRMPEWNLSLRALPTNALENSGSAVSDLAMTVVNPLVQQSNENSIGNTLLQQAVVPFTVVQEQPVEKTITNYIVQSGDTVLGIAERFGLRPETIQWANSSLEINPDLIRPGDVLNVLPFDGALHLVQPGDTLSTIAARYKVDLDAIIGYAPNNVLDATAALSVGAPLVIPGGTKPFVASVAVAYSGVVPTNASKGSGAFVWPTSGAISQSFWGGHRALDIGSWTGAGVKASDNGYVAVAALGWNTGYGNHVIVDHGNGFVTLYAHLNSVYVRQGESVTRGQALGSVGNTGNSTGPHLHFEIRYQGVQRNPFSYLP